MNNYGFDFFFLFTYIFSYLFDIYHSTFFFDKIYLSTLKIKIMILFGTSFFFYDCCQSMSSGNPSPVYLPVVDHFSARSHDSFVRQLDNKVVW
jgi:hypothetical protein